MRSFVRGFAIFGMVVGSLQLAFGIFLLFFEGPTALLFSGPVTLGFWWIIRSVTAPPAPSTPAERSEQEPTKQREEGGWLLGQKAERFREPAERVGITSADGITRYYDKGQEPKAPARRLDDKLTGYGERAERDVAMKMAEATSDWGSPAPVMPTPPPTMAPTAGSSIEAALRQLQSLHVAGLITGPEYEAKKKDILARI